MKQISNMEYEEYQQYQTDNLHGRILTLDGLRVICAGGEDQHPHAGDAGEVRSEDPLDIVVEDE